MAHGKPMAEMGRTSSTSTYGATHSNSRTPTLLIGNAGGALRTGRFIRIAAGERRTLADLDAPSDCVTADEFAEQRAE